MSMVDGGNAFSTFDTEAIGVGPAETIVELGGIVFHGKEQPTGFHFRRLPGWDDLPELKDRGEARPQGHGNFGTGQQFRASAVPSIEGWARADSRADALTLRRDFKAQFTSGEQPMTVTNELGPLTRLVSVRNVEVGDLYGHRFDFAIDCEANDPRAYGPSEFDTTGIPVAGGGLTWPITYPIRYLPGGAEGRVTVKNPGSAPTFTVLEISGGLSGGFSIREVGTSRELRLERLIPAGSTVTLNTLTGSTTIDGSDNDISGALVIADWFEIPPRSQSVLQFQPLGTVTGDPTLSARTAPAYW